ncbi:hypothetical protein AHF37_09198 [Paragonimus kellicotti]|nr:hypothetical protein AHF37_09198 [Paragonimus kellicotti]
MQIQKNARRTHMVLLSLLCRISIIVQATWTDHLTHYLGTKAHIQSQYYWESLYIPYCLRERNLAKQVDNLVSSSYVTTIYHRPRLG